MNTSLLEVDFEHLAWTPVSHKILKSLPGAVKPLDMARGKNDVYVKAEWVADTPEQIKDITNFKKIFDEIGDNKGVDSEISDAFLPEVGKNFEKSKAPIAKESTPEVAPEVTPEENTPEEEPKKHTSIEDLIKEMGLDNIDDIEDYDNLDTENVPDEVLQAEKVDYVPDEKYNYYVINEADNVIDSGWKDETAANNRLVSIEDNGAEGYAVEKYGTKLFKKVGDPTTVEWNPFGSFNFYVYDSTYETIDSGYDDEEAAKTRIKEINDLIKDVSELDSKYEVLTKEKALEKLGLSITSEVTWVPVEELLKKVEKAHSEALLEAVLTEFQSTPAGNSLGKFYLMFKFSPEFDPNDTSNRNGSSEEYFERDVFLDRLVSEDGSVQVSSKDLRKASEDANLQSTYQKLIKLINHTSEYFYNNLGFAKKPVTKLKGDRGYNPKADEIDNNPNPRLASEYIKAIEDVGSELKSKSSDAGTALAALGIAFRELASEEVGINERIKDIVDSGESSEIIAANGTLKEIQSIIMDKWEGGVQKQLLSTLDKIIVPYVLELNDQDEEGRIYSAILKMLKSDAASGEKLTNNPFARVTEVDPTNVAKSKKANVPTPASNIGAAGLPILFNNKLKEYNSRVAQAISTIQGDKSKAKNYNAANGSLKKKLVADEYQKLFGTIMSNDFKDIRDEHKNNILNTSGTQNAGYNYQTVRK